jgi:hypothetical protein
LGDEGCRTIQLAEKRSKLALNAISTFFGSKVPYKKQDEAQKLFMEDLVLLMEKGLCLLSTCKMCGWRG